jgi:hypothetical protein
VRFQGQVTSLRQQITNFEAVTLPDLRAQMHGAMATNGHRMKRQDSFHECYLSKCLFIIETGGNDYLLNYFNPRNNGTEEDRPPLSEFTRSLITKLSGHLQVPLPPKLNFMLPPKPCFSLCSWTIGHKPCTCELFSLMVPIVHVEIKAQNREK